jgi:hypothetical protein
MECTGMVHLHTPELLLRHIQETLGAIGEDNVVKIPEYCLDYLDILRKADDIVQKLLLDYRMYHLGRGIIKVILCVLLW